MIFRRELLRIIVRETFVLLGAYLFSECGNFRQKLQTDRSVFAPLHPGSLLSRPSLSVPHPFSRSPLYYYVPIRYPPTKVYYTLCSDRVLIFVEERVGRGQGYCLSSFECV